METTATAVNAGNLAKDESSDESTSEDDTDAIEREKQLAALQQQVFASHLFLILTSCCQWFMSVSVLHILSNMPKILSALIGLHILDADCLSNKKLRYRFRRA